VEWSSCKVIYEERLVPCPEQQKIKFPFIKTLNFENLSVKPEALHTLPPEAKFFVPDWGI
jgi:hypothetical protein